MAERFCESLFDLSDPESPKIAQAINDLEQNILKNDKNDDDSGGDDSDYEAVDNGKTAKDEKPQPNQSIKSKPKPASFSVKKKK